MLSTKSGARGGTREGVCDDVLCLGREQCRLELMRSYLRVIREGGHTEDYYEAMLSLDSKSDDGSARPTYCVCVCLRRVCVYGERNTPMFVLVMGR